MHTHCTFICVQTSVGMEYVRTILHVPMTDIHMDAHVPILSLVEIAHTVSSQVHQIMLAVNYY